LVTSVLVRGPTDELDMEIPSTVVWSKLKLPPPKPPPPVGALPDVDDPDVDDPDVEDDPDADDPDVDDPEVDPDFCVTEPENELSLSSRTPDAAETPEVFATFVTAVEASVDLPRSTVSVD
jgi:hypothetical protein